MNLHFYFYGGKRLGFWRELTVAADVVKYHVDVDFQFLATCRVHQELLVLLDRHEVAHLRDEEQNDDEAADERHWQNIDGVS